MSCYATRCRSSACGCARVPGRATSTRSLSRSPSLNRRCDAANRAGRWRRAHPRAPHPSVGAISSRPAARAARHTSTSRASAEQPRAPHVVTSLRAAASACREPGRRPVPHRSAAGVYRLRRAALRSSIPGSRGCMSTSVGRSCHAGHVEEAARLKRRTAASSWASSSCRAGCPPSSAPVPAPSTCARAAGRASWCSAGSCALAVGSAMMKSRECNRRWHARATQRFRVRSHGHTRYAR